LLKRSDWYIKKVLRRGIGVSLLYSVSMASQMSQNGEKGNFEKEDLVNSRGECATEKAEQSIAASDSHTEGNQEPAGGRAKGIEGERGKGSDGRDVDDVDGRRGGDGKDDEREVDDEDLVDTPVRDKPEREESGRAEKNKGKARYLPYNQASKDNTHKRPYTRRTLAPFFSVQSRSNTFLSNWGNTVHESSVETYYGKFPTDRVSHFVQLSRYYKDRRR